MMGRFWPSKRPVERQPDPPVPPKPPYFETEHEAVRTLHWMRWQVDHGRASAVSLETLYHTLIDAIIELDEK